MNVLIAEDDAVQRRMLALVLERAGYAVRPAADGLAAIDALRDRSIQLAILDWQMPGADGLEVCAHLKRLDRFVYAILLTADESSDLFSRALEAGASDFARKPFRTDELLARLRVGERIAQLQVQITHMQKLESLGQLAAGIAHEINTPMQFIGDNTHFLQEAFGTFQALHRAYLHLLERNSDSAVRSEVEAMLAAADLDFVLEEMPRSISAALEGIDRVSRIVRAMKEFSHPSSERPSAVDLNRCLESTITVARNEWKYVAEMVTELDPELPAVTCHPADLNQVFLNLLINAAHAIGERAEVEPGMGQIRVRSRRDGDWVEISIRDSGTGIPPEVRSRVFDPFFTTKAVGKGTGQGLALAHSVITGKHGGTIRFETELGRGTEFIVRVPIELEKLGTKEIAA